MALIDVQWYTNPILFQEMGINFNTDPAHPGLDSPAYSEFDYIYTKEDDGLSQQWYGNVWLSPPYPIQPWISKMVEHGSGVMMLINRTATPEYSQALFECDAVMILEHQLSFLREDGSEVTPDVDLSLFAFGTECKNALINMNYGVVLDVNSDYKSLHTASSGSV